MTATVRTTTGRSTAVLAVGLAGLVAITPLVEPAGGPAVRTTASAAGSATGGTGTHNAGEAAREGRSVDHGVVTSSRLQDQQPGEVSHAAKVVSAASASTAAGRARPADPAGAAREARTPSR